MSDLNILVVGPRRELVRVLQSRSICFSVWREKTGPKISHAAGEVIAPFWNTSERIQAWVSDQFGGAGFTHVIAGTENAVYPAAVARRVLSTRASSVTTALRCRDKLAMKEYLSAYEIPMTRYLPESSDRTAEDVFAHLGSPVVKKYRKSSGSRHIQFIYHTTDLTMGKGGRSLLEQFVDAPEASIESFVHQRQIQFSSITQYVEKGHVNFVPGSLDDAVSHAIGHLNRSVIDALKIDWGITHMEVYLTAKGPLFGEIALRPPGGYIMNAMQYAYDFNPWAAFVACEIGEAFDFPHAAIRLAAVEVFHPGCGVVSRIQGGSEVRDDAHTMEFKLKVKQGDQITQRAGTGQDVGHWITTWDTPRQREQGFARLRRKLKIAFE